MSPGGRRAPPTATLRPFLRNGGGSRKGGLRPRAGKPRPRPRSPDEAGADRVAHGEGGGGVGPELPGEGRRPARVLVLRLRGLRGRGGGGGADGIRVRVRPTARRPSAERDRGGERGEGSPDAREPHPADRPRRRPPGGRGGGRPSRSG